jgi:hypothetical protein
MRPFPKAREAKLKSNSNIRWTRLSKAKGKLDALLDGLGIKLVPVYRRRAAAQSHARGTMHEICNQYGDGHLVFVLRCIKQTKNNRDELWSETIGAISDIVIQRQDWAMERAGDVLDAFRRHSARSAARRGCGPASMAGAGDAPNSHL